MILGLPTAACQREARLAPRVADDFRGEQEPRRSAAALGHDDPEKDTGDEDDAGEQGGGDLLIDLAPFLLVGGASLLDALPNGIRLEKLSVSDGPFATALRYQVIRVRRQHRTRA